MEYDLSDQDTWCKLCNDSAVEDDRHFLCGCPNVPYKNMRRDWYAGVKNEMQKMISLYDAREKAGKVQTENENISNPWFPQQEMIKSYLENKWGYLKRAGCIAGRKGLSTKLAVQVANTMTI